MKNVIFFMAIAMFLVSWILVIRNTFKDSKIVKKDSNKWKQLMVERWFVVLIVPAIYIALITIANIKQFNFDNYFDKVNFIIVVCMFCLFSVLFFLGARAFRILRKSTTR